MAGDADSPAPARSSPPGPTKVLSAVLRSRVPAGKRIRHRITRFSLGAIIVITIVALCVALGLLRLGDLKKTRLFGRPRRRRSGGRPATPPADTESTIAHPASTGAEEIATRELVHVPLAQESAEGQAAPRETVSFAEVQRRAMAAFALATTPHADANASFAGFVYTLWHAHSFAFSQVAYSNTEALLSVLPQAQVRFFSFAPIQSQGYRLADGLSRMHFQRYAKRGYSIRMRMANELWGPYVRANPAQRRRFPEQTNVGQDRPAHARPGEGWWLRHRQRFPYSRNNHGGIKTLQPHPRDAFFMVVVHLYLTGGMYTDHTVAFRRLDPGVPAQAAMYGDECPGHGSEAVLDGVSDGYLGWDLGLPMVLSFAAENHPVLQCILQKYDAAASEGGSALSPLEGYCLLPGPQRGSSPDLFYGDDTNQGFSGSPSPEELRKIRPGHGGCARFLFESCTAATNSVVRRIPIAWRGCNADFHWDQWNGRRDAADSFERIAQPPDVVLSGVDGVWTGPAYQGSRWEEPPKDHFISREIYEVHRATRWDPPALEASLLATDMRHLVETLSVPDGDRLLREEDTDLPSCSARIPSCHPYFSDYPDLLDEVAGSVGQARSGRSKPPISPKNVAEVKCSPALIVPGVEKGATTYLFTLLYQHPQILPPLRGAGFKESGAFLSRLAGAKNLWEKAHRFPYIREGEPFVTGDATILNMMDPLVPERLRRDQPNPRVIFSLREPTDRAWSGYRFSWGVYYGAHVPDQSFPNIVNRGISSFSDCMAGRSDPDVEWEEETSNYFSCKEKGDPYHTVWKGLYYFPVLQWTRIFGASNVMVITSEELTTEPLRVLREVFEFVGLCTEGLDLDVIAKGATTNPTPRKRGDEIGIHGKTNETTHALREFYRPFNEKLYELIGRRLPWVP